jgi:hypothetical protein
MNPISSVSVVSGCDLVHRIMIPEVDGSLFFPAGIDRLLSLSIQWISDSFLRVKAVGVGSWSFTFIYVVSRLTFLPPYLHLRRISWHGVSKLKQYCTRYWKFGRD